MLLEIVHECIAMVYQSDLIGYCTAIWKTNGKTTTLLLFLDSIFPKTETNAKCFLWRQNDLEVNHSPI
jgi:hypothetical protein